MFSRIADSLKHVFYDVFEDFHSQNATTDEASRAQETASVGALERNTRPTEGKKGRDFSSDVL
jgi:hypothetical protein